MVDFNAIDETITVCGQLSEHDMEAVVARGFTLLINNRPDGEADDQPSSEEVASWAARHGIDYHHLPVTSRQMALHDVAAFGGIYGLAEGPTLAFCRSGMRSAILWAMTMATVGGLEREEIVSRAQTAGYDITSLHSALDGLIEVSAENA